MWKEKLSQSDPVSARIFLLIDALSGSLVQRIPGPVGLPSLYPARWD